MGYYYFWKHNIASLHFTKFYHILELYSHKVISIITIISISITPKYSLMAFCNLHLLFLHSSFLRNHLLIFCHYKLLCMLDGSVLKNLLLRELWVQSLGWEDSWRRKWQLAWKIPSTEEPSGLLSMGLQKSCTCLVTKQQHICVYTYVYR